MDVERNALKTVSPECPNLVALSRIVSYLLSSSRLGDSQRHTKDGVCTELSLVWSAIKLGEELINLWLILDIDVLLDESGSNDIVDVGYSLGDTLSTPLGLVSITELDSLVLTCISSRVSLYSWVGNGGTCLSKHLMGR